MRLTSPTYPIYNFPTHIFVDEDGIVRNIVMAQMNREEAIAAAEWVIPNNGETISRSQD